jgi:hypothetical protein
VLGEWRRRRRGGRGGVGRGGIRGRVLAGGSCMTTHLLQAGACWWAEHKCVAQAHAMSCRHGSCRAARCCDMPCRHAVLRHAARRSRVRWELRDM